MKCECDELRDKLRQRVKFCRECGDDAQKEMDEISRERDHWQRLAEAAELLIRKYLPHVKIMPSEFQADHKAWQKIKDER